MAAETPSQIRAVLRRWIDAPGGPFAVRISTRTIDGVSLSLVEVQEGGHTSEAPRLPRTTFTTSTLCPYDGTGSTLVSTARPDDLAEWSVRALESLVAETTEVYTDADVKRIGALLLWREIAQAEAVPPLNEALARVRKFTDSALGAIVVPLNRPTKALPVEEARFVDRPRSEAWAGPRATGAGIESYALAAVFDEPSVVEVRWGHVLRGAVTHILTRWRDAVRDRELKRRAGVNGALAALAAAEARGARAREAMDYVATLVRLQKRTSQDLARAAEAYERAVEGYQAAQRQVADAETAYRLSRNHRPGTRADSTEEPPAA